MKRVKVIINGTVQGVGFRPFIYRTAKRFDLKGYVENTSFGVIIDFEGKVQNITSAIQFIQKNNPRGSVIENIQTEQKNLVNYSEFSITQTHDEHNNKISISPDLSICKECANEIKNLESRFYKYPFISCASCGPRLTIMESLPYDRLSTCMKDFDMCEQCYHEYTNPEDRRYHAQTISCHNCGPSLWMENSLSPIKYTVEELSQGEIVAIKGIGGYHIACDAKNDDSVKLLRTRKKRDYKPFAVMMDINTVYKHCHVSKHEKQLLESPQSPIVLLKQKKDSDISKFVNPNVNTLGVMLPYTGIHKMLIDDIDVLVMTSGNISGNPILNDEKEAEYKLKNVYDKILNHNRRITIECDDSVMKVLNDNTVMLRHSRGFAPSGLKLEKVFPPLLACGGDLKNTFCIYSDQNIYMSQYMGDLENKNTFDKYVKNIDTYKRLLNIDFKLVACDRHPEYQSVKYAKELELPITYVQHHHAHIVSAMAEHKIYDEVIGIAFDGTGYGDDNNIWGGEFFTATRKTYNREYHFEYIKMPGGETAIKQPWRMALSYLYNIFNDLPEIEFLKRFGYEELNIVNKLLINDFNSPYTSSVGRLFDAVSSLIGIKDVISYEGQAAIEMEAIRDDNTKDIYNFAIKHNIIITKPIIREIVEDIKNGVKPEIVSAKFHNTMAQIVVEVCVRINKLKGLNKVVLSGGVFQNFSLLEVCMNKLTSRDFKVYFNNKYPLNDGGISLGQSIVTLENL